MFGEIILSPLKLNICSKTISKPKKSWTILNRFRKKPDDSQCSNGVALIQPPVDEGVGNAKY